MFLRFLCLVFLFSYGAKAEVISVHKSADVNCPAGTLPKITKKGNEVIVICLDASGKKAKTIKKTHKKIAPVKEATIPVTTKTSDQPEEVLIRHYYVPLQKKDSQQPVVDTAQKIQNQALSKKEESVSDGFDGFFIGLMYDVTMLNATNKYTSSGPYASPAPSGVENASLLEHGPLLSLGYSSLFYNKRLLVGAEIRMGYSIPGSNSFAPSTQKAGLYTYNNFANNIFNLPSFHMRFGVLLGERLLPYITAGVGVYQINYNNTGQFTASGATAIPVSGSQISANFPVGAGIEFALTRYVHLRAEYLYTFFVPMSNSFSTANGGSPESINYNYTMGSSTILAGIMICF